MPTNVWYVTINLADTFHNEDLDFEEKVERIVDRIKRSGWRLLTDDTENFDLLVEQLETSSDKHEFNATWDEVLDLADLDRVWIETF